MPTDLDRAKADAIHALDSARQRAVAVEREIDQYQDLLASLPLGMLLSLSSTLAEYERRLTALEQR